jgi:hypothetical protein
MTRTETNLKVAELLGWKIVDKRGHRQFYPYRVWIDPEGNQGIAGHYKPEEDADALPNWAGDLNVAWELHKKAPEGVTLFNFSWFQLESPEVAQKICESFIRWKITERGV